MGQVNFISIVAHHFPTILYSASASILKSSSNLVNVSGHLHLRIQIFRMGVWLYLHFLTTKLDCRPLQWYSCTADSAELGRNTGIKETPAQGAGKVIRPQQSPSSLSFKSLIIYFMLWVAFIPRLLTIMGYPSWLHAFSQLLLAVSMIIGCSDCSANSYA